MTEIMNETLDKIKNDFFILFALSKFEFDAIICDALEARFFALRPDLKGIVTGDLNQFNGTMVHPQKKNGTFTLLINQKYVDKTEANGTRSWLGTFAHEATHIVDYRAYLGLSGAADYDEIRYSGRHEMFFYWTEFHARKNGYYFWQKQTGVEYDDMRLKVITVQEYPFQKNELLKQLNASPSEQKRMYYLCQFLGRLSVWEDAYPDFFAAEKVNTILENFGSSVVELYRFFRVNADLNITANSFQELELVVNKIF